MSKGDPDQLELHILHSRGKILQLKGNSHAQSIRSCIFAIKKPMLILVIILALKRLLNAKNE